MSDDTTPPRGFSIFRLLRFMGRQRAYILLAPVVVLLGTVMHEGAHAAAILAQGGEVTKVVVMPNTDLGYFSFGYVRWKGEGMNEDLISVAPALLSLGLAWMMTLMLWKGRPSVGTRLGMILGFMLPLVDVSQSCSNLMMGAKKSDWYSVFAGREDTVALLCGGIAAIHLLTGWRLFLRVWSREALSFFEFALGFAVVLAIPWSLAYVTV